MNRSHLNPAGKALAIINRRWVMLSLFLLLTGMSVAAEDLAQIMELADNGQATAQDKLGIMYANGNGVPKNSNRAVELFRKSADQGLPSAQFHLALSYQNGHGVKQNYTEAARWFLMAAQQGHVRSQRSLGGLYSSGRGVQQDHAVANQWFRKAADSNDTPAQYYLGVSYQNGHGVQADEVVAASWFRKAAEGGYAKAQYSLGFMYANGVGVQRDLNEAVLWIRKAADQGLPIAQSAIVQLNTLIENVQQREAETISSESLATTVRKDSRSDKNRIPVSGQAGDSLSEEERLKAATLERIRQRRASQNNPRAGEKVDSRKTDQGGLTFLGDRRIWIIFSGLLLIFGVIWLLRVRK